MTDVIDVVGAVATVIALIWAIVATIRTRRDMLEETRKQFELGLLADMWKVLSETRDVSALQGHVGALIRDRNDSPDLPLLRSYLGVKPDPTGQSLLFGVEDRLATDSHLISDVQDEIDEAINRRVSER